jgi:hypothetical protein
MTMLHTLDRRRGEAPLESVFKAILDKIAEQPDIDITLLFPPPVGYQSP